MTLYSTDIRKIQKFGTIAFLFFGVLCALGFWRQKFLPVYLFGFLSTLGLGFILIPFYLKPVYVAWLKIAHFLGKIFTTLVLILVYYLVITPSALIKSLFGGRPLPVLPNKKSLSYWVTRTEPAQSKERFLKRY
jgi:hypothetical protein